LIIAAAHAVGLPLLWHFWSAREQPPVARATKPVPVFLVKAAARDVPVWLENFGTVQAFNTVTVRPRVSGTIDSVNFTEGQRVKKGDILARIDPRPYQAALAQAKAKKAQDEALLKNARREFERARGLAEEGGESQRTVDLQEASVAQLEAAVQADQAAVDAAQLDLDFTTLRAPIAGLTGFRLLDAGNTVTANQTEGLVVVTQMQPISLVFTLPQRHLAVLRKRLRAGGEHPLAQALQDGADPDSENRVLATGSLDIIDNQVDSATDNLRLKATFPNEHYELRPGQYVGARVLVEMRKDAVLVPKAALQDGTGGSVFVYVVKADNTVEARVVATGPETGGDIVIERGLAAGELVVREGQNKLRPGMKVEPLAEKP